MKITDSDSKAKLKARLARLEGQLRGIQKMVDEDRECQDIVQQLSAVRSGLNSANQAFLQVVADECILNLEDKNLSKANLDNLISLVGKL